MEQVINKNKEKIIRKEGVYLVLPSILSIQNRQANLLGLAPGPHYLKVNGSKYGFLGDHYSK